jgi:hypothetical protein
MCVLFNIKARILQGQISLLEELSIVQPLMNPPAFYGTRRFNTVFTRALHWSLF